MNHLKKVICHFGGKYFTCDCVTVISEDAPEAKMVPRKQRTKTVRISQSAVAKAGEVYERTGQDENRTSEDPKECKAV